MFSNGLRKKAEATLEAPLLPTDQVAEDDSEDDDLEEGLEAEEALDAILQRVYEWGRAWSETSSFAALSQEQKDEAEYITTSFTEYTYTYQGVAPDDWNVAALEECCLGTLPRKITAEDVYFRSLAPVLSNFFTFLDQTGRLPHAAKLAVRIRSLDKTIIKAAADPRNWGMAKSFAMAAMAAGVDLNDRDKMDRFMMQHNAEIAAQNAPWPDMLQAQIMQADTEPVAETYERSGPKVGRNDPCPCGSGKKYKKCCGV